MNNAKTEKTCAAAGKCGGCTYLHESYEKQLEKKENEVKKALSGVCRVNPIAGMQEPYHYRNKVHAVFSRLGKKVITGSYREDSHQVVPVENCLLEDEQAGKRVRGAREGATVGGCGVGCDREQGWCRDAIQDRVGAVRANS